MRNKSLLLIFSSLSPFPFLFLSTLLQLPVVFFFSLVLDERGCAGSRESPALHSGTPANRSENSGVKERERKTFVEEKKKIVRKKIEQKISLCAEMNRTSKTGQ